MITMISSGSGVYFRDFSTHLGPEMFLEINCLVVLLLAIGTVDSLKCYQCNSSDHDLKPQCDRLYWKQMSSQERDDLVIDCQKRLSFFCIVIRKEVGGVVITTRGCIGQKDVKGTTLNAGCVEISSLEQACLCTDNLCNAAYRGAYLLGTFGVTFSILRLFL